MHINRKVRYLMTDRTDNQSTADKMARTIATIALILSLIALGWAINAHRRAEDAINKINNTVSRQTI